MPTKIAVYPGFFDPVTFGHIDILERAAKLFGKVVVAVGDNPQKRSLFSVKERVSMLKESTKHIKNAEVKAFNGLLLNFVEKQRSKIIIRGLRAVSDFDYEFQRALMNRTAAPDIETVFIMTEGKYSFLSSSIVKEAAQFGGCVAGLVPKIVEKKLKEKFS